MIVIRNFLERDLDDLPNCHDGNGVLKHIQLFAEQDFKSSLRFLNYTVLPPGTSIGPHKHGNDEEIYIVIEGNGQMTLDGVTHQVGAGSIILNQPYGEHGLDNTGNCDIKLLVFENGVE